MIADSVTLGAVYGLIAALHASAENLSPWVLIVSIACGAAICACVGYAINRWVRVWRLIRESPEMPVDAALSPSALSESKGFLTIQPGEQTSSPGSRSEASPNDEFELIICERISHGGTSKSVNRERVSRRRLKRLVAYLFDNGMLEWSANETLDSEDQPPRQPVECQRTQ